MDDQTIHSFSVFSNSGENVHLEKFKGKVLLIVNVASKCGFTPQYKGLQSLYEKLASKGFEVLAFPCNQFGGQEPGTDEEIKNFCELSYKVSFPIFKKIDVNGQNADPLYAFMKSEKAGILGTEAIKWNFTKFLISKKGKVLGRYAPNVTPESLENEILQALAQVD